jgi:predicted transcriptional regulator
MDFACKTIDVQQILKCSLGLSKAGCSVLRELMSQEDWITSEELAITTGYDLATVQRSLKHLHERNVVKRIQHNREVGGYEYYYLLVDKKAFRNVVTQTMEEWMQEARKELTEWLE